jgi:transposase InsO family protein
MIDRTTRWLEAVPLCSMEAATFVDAFINTWVPAVFTMDRGQQFTSMVWAAGLCQRLGTDHITTMAYHPQSNSMVERAHRQLKDALRSRLAGERWPEHLPWMLLSPREGSAVSSEELVFGAPLTLPGQLLASLETTVQQVV